MVIRTYPQVPPDYRDDEGGEGPSGGWGGEGGGGRLPGRQLSVVVLAAGEGTRMRSARPKPLHRLCGRPMVLHVLDALVQLPVSRVVVVVGHRADWVTKTLVEHAPPGLEIEFVEQEEQRGTGDAMSVALTGLPDDEGSDEGDVVVLPGDTPLLRPASLAALVYQHRLTDAAATLLTAELADPAGYGRVVRGRDNSVARVVEHDDATDLYAAGHQVGSVVVEDTMEVAGVNDRAQLAIAEAELRDRINERWMRRGVTMWDPERTYIDVDVMLEPDVVLLPGVILQGSCVIGSHAEIGPEAHLVDTVVGEGAVVASSVCRRSIIGDEARIGPFAVLDEGTEVPAGGVVGRTPAPKDAPGPAASPPGGAGPGGAGGVAGVAGTGDPGGGAG
jgi:bifunctional UDP-N-acetylglucosamine pyrophosphorylase/glucosamine-1-phosphate N-acetyltransferase